MAMQADYWVHIMPQHLERRPAFSSFFKLSLCSLAALALPGLANAEFYSVNSPFPWYAWSFDPLTGASTQGYDNNAVHPLRLILDGSNATLTADASLFLGTDFEFVGTGSNLFTLLAAGTPIDASSAFAGGSGTSTSDGPVTLDGSTIYYAGFRYLNQGGGNETYYGWASFTASPGMMFGDNVSLLEFGVLDGGGGVLAGATSAIPEPSGAAGFAGLAAAGACLLRRRRRV